VTDDAALAEKCHPLRSPSVNSNNPEGSSILSAGFPNGCAFPARTAGSDWLYLQMVKQRDERGRVNGIKRRVRFGKKSEVIALLGKSTAYVERSKLTSRLFNGRPSVNRVSWILGAPTSSRR
jgi:hypothetical protein